MRLIDADAIPYKRDIVVTERLPRFGGFNGKMVYNVTKEELDAIPTVDAVPVVRCKDCKHRQYDSMDGSFYCGGAFGGIETEADFFCKDGDHT